MILSSMSNIHQTWRHEKHEYFYTVESAIKLLGEAGFDGVDVSMVSVTAHGNIMGTDSWKEFVANCGCALEEAKIVPAQSHAYFPQVKNVVFGTEEYAWHLEMTKRSIIASGMLGIPWTTVHPIYGPVAGDRTPDEIISANVEYFRILGETAEKANVGIAIENMISQPFCKLDNLLMLLERLGNSDRFGICLDTGHANISGWDIAGEIRRMGKNLRATHIHDNRKQQDLHLLPGMGDIPWEQVMPALREIGYEGAFSYEVPQLTRNTPRALHPDLIQYAEKLGRYMLKEEEAWLKSQL